jgi:hypothetical protein
MNKQLLIYDRVVPVNRQEHRGVSVKRTTSFDFAAGLNSVPIVDAEFSRVALEMPIVFAQTETGIVSLALLGTAENRNSFVDEKGSWTGRYVPAFLRRYPFVFAVDEAGQRMTLCVDDTFPGLNDEDKGERLFDGEGNETTYLSTVLRFMEEYQATFNRTQAFCDRLKERDLLEEARIDYRLANGQQGGVTGFWRVSNEKLRALPDEEIVEMFRTGDLDLVQLHMLSMHNAEPLVNRSMQGAAAPAEDPPVAGDAEEMGLE